MTIVPFTRVLFAFALVFLAVPLLAQGHRLWRGEPINRGPVEWMPLVLRAFVLASFSAEVMGLALGSVRLCLPGLVIAACVVWSAEGLLRVRRVRSGLTDEDAAALWRPIMTLFTPAQSPNLWRQASFGALTGWPAGVGALLMVTLYVFARPALTQIGFDYPDNYSRSVSLAALTSGSPWEPDGSIALLAPLVSFSGLDAASVVRFAGPIFGAVFAALAVLCVWQATRTYTLPALTLGLFICAAAVASAHGSWEFSPVFTAIVYWTGAAVIWAYSKSYSLLAATTGFLIAPVQWVPPVIGLLLILSIRIAVWMRSQRRLPGPSLATAACLAISCFSVVLWYWTVPDAQPSEYESAARTCTRITREFPRNEWLVVSPFQELAFTYGHGWHLELSDFVSQFDHVDVASPTFSFPYKTQDIFFFIERRPFRPDSGARVSPAIWRYSPAESNEWATFLNSDPLGRAALEYKAAELLTDYSLRHKDLSLFYKDDLLTVYHLATQPGVQ